MNNDRSWHCRPVAVCVVRESAVSRYQDLNARSSPLASVDVLLPTAGSIVASKHGTSATVARRGCPVTD